ncbi:MAG TPA: hypothetical protein DD738_03185 [Ruminiclostridium sp.]|nr:hypothetical protein [Ruminiclostridium sp.]
MGKEFSSTNTQIYILKSRGLIINSRTQAKRILQKENYYNLINGYKDLFLDKTYGGADEKYLKNTNFDEIYALYMFDRELRNLFLKYILEIENNLKSVLAHDFSKKYGHDNYLKIDNFDITVKVWEKNKTASQKVGDVADLIAGIQREISNQLRKNNSMISHHILQYGYIPLWVLINTLSLGTVSIFYSYLKQKDQNDIGRVFKIKPDEMNNLLSVLTIYRNACAHDERLYCLKSIKKNRKHNSIKTNWIHTKLAIPLDATNNPVNGKNDLYSIIIIFKLMLKKKSFHEFYIELYKAIESLDKRLKTITINAVLGDMGFPVNWKDIKSI